MPRVRKLSPAKLRQMVLRERRRLFESDPILKGIKEPDKVVADEVDADGLADTLEKDIDHLKVLKVHERSLVKKLRRIQEAKKILKRKLLRKL